MEKLRATYGSKERLSKTDWVCRSFVEKPSPLKRKGYCDQSGRKLIGKFQLLNRLLRNPYEALFLDDEWKIVAEESNYGNFAFEIWHGRNLDQVLNLKSLQLLEWLLTRAALQKEKKEKKTKSHKTETNWVKVTLNPSDSVIDRLSEDFAHIDNKGIRFYHSENSVDYDFFVKVQKLYQEHTHDDWVYKGNRYQGMYCNECQSWIYKDLREVPKSRKSSTVSVESACVTLKYRKSDPKFEIFEYDNRADKMEFLQKLMCKSLIDVTPKKTKNRGQKQKRLLQNQF